MEISTSDYDDPIVNQDNDITNAQDLPDTPKDQEQLKTEPVTLDLPEVKDISGQENIVPMPLGELADTTISSDDEEGVGILDFEDEEGDAITNTSAELTNQGNKEDTYAGTAIEDGVQLKDGETDITNAQDQAANDIDNDDAVI